MVDDVWTECSYSSLNPAWRVMMKQGFSQSLLIKIISLHHKNLWRYLLFYLNKILNLNLINIKKNLFYEDSILLMNWDILNLISYSPIFFKFYKKIIISLIPINMNIWNFHLSKKLKFYAEEDLLFHWPDSK